MYGPSGYDAAGPPPGMHHGGPRGGQYGMRGADIGGPRHGRGGGGGYGKRGYDSGRKVATRLPELHSIHQVEILNAFHDGIFVRIPGFDADGLIHHSQISRNLELTQDTPKVERFRQIEALVGDIDYNVYVKVVYVADLPDHLKCECSLKMVSQRDGRDLDEDHSMWLDYMRKRRIRGAGSFTAPNMRSELDRVARSLGEHVTPGGPRGRYQGTPNSALEKPVLRPSDMRAPKSERRRLHAGDPPHHDAPMPLPAAMRPNSTNGGRTLDYPGGHHDWPPSGFPAAHDQRYDVAPQYGAPPPGAHPARAEGQGFPDHERMPELAVKPDPHYAQDPPRHGEPRSISPHDASAYPPRAAAASDDTMTDVAYGSSTAKHPPPDVAFHRGDHSPPIALGDVSGLPAPSSGDAYQSGPPGGYNDHPADGQAAAVAGNGGNAPPAVFNMLPEDMKAMIAQMVEQKASEQVAMALAEEKRKRKKRNKSDRDADDDAPRRSRRERSRSRSP